jgi:hypothetical protein
MTYDKKLNGVIEERAMVYDLALALEISMR